MSEVMTKAADTASALAAAATLPTLDVLPSFATLPALGALSVLEPLAPAQQAPAYVLPEPLAAVALPACPAPAPDQSRRMEDLVRQYGRLIGAIVRRVGRQVPMHVREDIEQRVLIALWKQLRRDQTIDHPTTYIYKTAVRETMRVARQEAGRAQEPIEEDGPAGGVPSRDDPYDTLARKEKMGRIREAIAAIAPDRRHAVQAHLSGFAVTEIMKQHGWSYQKARNLIARGMADVRAILRESGLGPRAASPPPPPLSSRLGPRETTDALRSSVTRAHRAKLRMLKIRHSSR